MCKGGIWAGFYTICGAHAGTNNVVSLKRAHYGLSAHPPVLFQFPAEVSAHLAQTLQIGMSHSSKPEDVVKLVYTHYKVQIAQASLTISAALRAHYDTILIARMLPPLNPPRLSPR